MNKLTNLLELNEKDNALTATAKGLADGAIKGAAFWVGVAGTLYVCGKIVQAIDTLEETKEDDGE